MYPPEGFDSAVPSPLPDPEVLVLDGVDNNPRSATEAAGQRPHCHDCHWNVDPETPAYGRSNEPGGDCPTCGDPAHPHAAEVELVG